MLGPYKQPFLPIPLCQLGGHKEKTTLITQPNSQALERALYYMNRLYICLGRIAALLTNIPPPPLPIRWPQRKNNFHYLTKFSGMGISFYVDTITLGLNMNKRRITLGLGTMAIPFLLNTTREAIISMKKFQKFQFVFWPSIEIGVKPVSVLVSADPEVSWRTHPNIYGHQGMGGLKCQHAEWPLKDLFIIWIDYIYAWAV